MCSTYRRLLAKLEALGWPTPFAEPLDPFEDPKVAEFQTAFVDLLTLELLCVDVSLYPESTSVTEDSEVLSAQTKQQRLTWISLEISSPVEEAKTIIGVGTARSPSLTQVQMAIRWRPYNKSNRQGE